MDSKLPPLDVTDEDLGTACGPLYERYYDKDDADIRRDLACRERQLEDALTRLEKATQVIQLAHNLLQSLQPGCDCAVCSAIKAFLEAEQ